MEYFLQSIEAQVAMPPDCYICKTSVETGRIDIKGRKVWRHKSSQHPYYLIWDSLHGEIEVFHKKTLLHMAVYHPNGDIKSGPVAGRDLRFGDKK